ncbi:TetR/AcrR family transcriptional regulator [Micromonospora coxensis]|uniref:Transcriptional regulator, TetR family n=1 Tax=Micromonospora coxensis TaxID=356852 RepID=A0A1C5JHW1_9ACTN|nr:TetR/AcrR family transcriptional regulator [Micromonospora coxensis]SCG70142.1 transcriptional regulator, TetR family [Micromonospora coxensis]
MSAPTRRERLRTATLSEIKEGARRLLVTGGIEAVSLRAIARDMGMTAPAIYRYFPSLEALVGGLAGDLYDELRQHIEAARDAAGPEPTEQLAQMCRAMRRWAVGHPAEFTLIFGNPVPGLAEFTDSCVDPDHPGARFGAVFLGPFVELTRGSRLPGPPAADLRRLLDGHLTPLAVKHGELPIEVAYAFLSAWTRLYGLVAMEVFGHLSWAVDEPEALFETELVALLTQLRPDDAGDGLTPGAARH